MAKANSYAFSVVTLRDGCMTCVQNYDANEVDRACLYIEHASGTGAHVRVVISGRQDGLELNKVQIGHLAQACEDIVHPFRSD